MNNISRNAPAATACVSKNSACACAILAAANQDSATNCYGGGSLAD
jgi:hypothetical protein